MALWKKLLLIGFSAGSGLVFALVLVGGAWYWYEQRPGPTRDWPVRKIESLNLNASLKTKWRSGRIQFQFDISPASDVGKPVFHDSLSSSRGHDSVAIQFYDAAGFLVCQIPVSESDFTHTMDAAGKLAVLDVNSSGYCGRSDYEAAEKWSMTWKILPDATPKATERPRSRQEAKVVVPVDVSPVPSLEIKQPRPVEKWRNRLNWRSLSKGMSKAEVRQLLGEPAKIQGGILEYWYYGTGGILGAYVSFSNNTVSGWQEP